jgi:hypothetical protein
MPFKNSMLNYRWLSLILLLLLSCDKPLPTLEGFDAKIWKDDRNACNGKRASMEDNLKGEKQKLLALTELQVIDVLGRPDQNELFKRNQKFYTYFIEPASACTSDTTAHKAKRLVVRFNAMGLAKEITIE